jgi:hypothetical protein
LDLLEILDIKDADVFWQMNSFSVFKLKESVLQITCKKDEFVLNDEKQIKFANPMKN